MKGLHRIAAPLSVLTLLVAGACSSAIQPEPAPTTASPVQSVTPTPSPTPTPTSPTQALVTAAVAAGLPCAEWSPAEVESYEDFTEGAVCVEGSELYIYPSVDEVDDDIEGRITDSTWEYPLIWGDNWVIEPDSDLSQTKLKTVATALDAKLHVQDPKYKAIYKKAAKKAKKIKRFSTWEKNMRNKPGGNALDEYYDRSDAVVTVCGALIDGYGIEGSSDYAASQIRGIFDEESIEEWSPDPEVTIEAFAGSFVSIVWATKACGVNVDN